MRKATKALRTVLLLVISVAAVTAAAVGPYTAGVPYRGVSQAGFEFDNQYYQPLYASSQWYFGAGANLIRVPFRWDRLQVPNSNGAPTTDSGTDTGNAVFDNNYWTLIQNLVNDATSKGAIAILDMHNYARYPAIQGNTCGGNQWIGIGAGRNGGPATYNHFAGAWTKIAQAYNTNPNVWFGLMNEPSTNCNTNDYTAYTSLDARNLMVAGVQGARAGATSSQPTLNKILISGTMWTGAHDFVCGAGKTQANPGGCFYGDGNDINFGGSQKITDGNLAIEVHTYFDTNHSGNTVECVSYSPSAILGSLTSWATSNGYQLFLGEVGWQIQWTTKPQINTGTTCSSNAAALLAYLNQYTVTGGAGPWLGWAYWAGGPAWGTDQTGVGCPTTSACTVTCANGQNFQNPEVFATGTPYSTTQAPFTPLSGAGDAEPDWYANGGGSCTPPNSAPNLNNPCASIAKPVGFWLTQSQTVPSGGSITAWNPSQMNTAGSSSTSSTSGSSTSGSSTSGSSTSGSSTSGSSTSGSSTSGSGGSCTNPAAAAGAQCGNSAGYPLSQGSTPPSSFACCPSGYSCQWVNNYWWQCNTATSGSSGSTSGSSTSGSSTSGSSTSGSSTSGSSTSGGSGGACIADWQQCGTNSPFDGSYASSASAGCCTQPGYQGTGVYKGCSQPGGTGYWQCKPS